MNYWLADSEARVLGPIGLEVVRNLHVRGKLNDVRAVSTDGATFVPLKDVPELAAVLSSPVTQTDATRAQIETTQHIREWLRASQGRPAAELFKVNASASRDTWRAAFFTLVHRYVPSRLPPDTTPELRLACEDAFLFLAERMLEVERQFRAPAASPPVPVAAPPPLPAIEPNPAAQVTVRGQTLQVKLSLKAGDARPFTHDKEHHWQTDALFIHSASGSTPGMQVDLVISFEGHVTQLHAAGRVMAVRVGGFTIRLLNLGETERSLIRTWVARATVR
ncbi:MAG: hypothetical protein U0228_18655 [Myxococcaceae bacterium]